MSKKADKFRLNESSNSTEFTRKLNLLVDNVNKANNLGITVTGSGSGTIDENFRGNNIAIKIPRRVSTGGGGGATSIRTAKLSEDATTTDKIKGNLLSTTTGKEAKQATLDDDSADDKEDGTVGIPSTAHGFDIGESVLISGTDYYDGNATLTSATTADEMVITATYEAETFDTDMTATSQGYNQDIFGSMLNSTRLDRCMPRLAEDDVIAVYLRKYDNTDRLDEEVEFDSGPVVDKFNGLVGIPATAHGLSINETGVIAGTTNYNGTHTVNEATTVDEIVITATYVSESVTSADTFTVDGNAYDRWYIVDILYGSDDYSEL